MNNPQITTTWKFTRGANTANPQEETCALIKEIDNNNLPVYADPMHDLARVKQEQYKEWFDLTVSYMQTVLNWTVLPTFEESYILNATECPADNAYGHTYEVKVKTWVCSYRVYSEAMKAVINGNTGRKVATEFEYFIDNASNGTVRLVKTLTNAVPVFYEDNEIANMGTESESSYVSKLNTAFALTVQYIGQLGWLATPARNLSFIIDPTECPLPSFATTHLDKVNATINGGAGFDDLQVTVEFNGNTKQIALTEDDTIVDIYIDNVDINDNTNNLVVIKVDNPNYKIVTSLDSIAKEVDDGGYESANTVGHNIIISTAELKTLIINSGGLQVLPFVVDISKNQEQLLVDVRTDFIVTGGDFSAAPSLNMLMQGVDSSKWNMVNILESGVNYDNTQTGVPIPTTDTFTIKVMPTNIGGINHDNVSCPELENLTSTQKEILADSYRTCQYTLKRSEFITLISDNKIVLTFSLENNPQ
ncbi:MAG: hypothetical protein LBM67_08465 [Lentimicrobiaceae bacterium]|jgi:hypothetical protein|nr:hypothetical protein [Lentimicrobiaceae bacterium]